jgi:hypothetical protein
VVVVVAVEVMSAASPGNESRRARAVNERMLAVATSSVTSPESMYLFEAVVDDTHAHEQARASGRRLHESVTLINEFKSSPRQQMCHRGSNTHCKHKVVATAYTTGTTFSKMPPPPHTHTYAHLCRMKHTKMKKGDERARCKIIGATHNIAIGMPRVRADPLNAL